MHGSRNERQAGGHALRIANICRAKEPAQLLLLHIHSYAEEPPGLQCHTARLHRATRQQPCPWAAESKVRQCMLVIGARLTAP